MSSMADLWSLILAYSTEGQARRSTCESHKCEEPRDNRLIYCEFIYCLEITPSPITIAIEAGRVNVLSDGCYWRIISNGNRWLLCCDNNWLVIIILLITQLLNNFVSIEIF